MSTPDGSPSRPVTAGQAGQLSDAAVQAAAGEATVIGTNQDVSTLGAGDAASGQAAQRGGAAMQPAASQQFTRED